MLLSMLLKLLGTKGKLAVDIGLGLILVLAIGGAWFYKHEADKRLAQAVELKDAYDSTVNAVQEYAKKLSERNQQIDELNTIYEQIRSKADERMQIFATHNVAADAQAHPDMLLKRVNHGTASMFDALEKASNFGSSPNPSKEGTTKAP